MIVYRKNGSLKKNLLRISVTSVHLLEIHEMNLPNAHIDWYVENS